MHGRQERTAPMFSHTSTEKRIQKGHRLWQARRLTVQALDQMYPTFCRLYPWGDRPLHRPGQSLPALMGSDLDAAKQPHPL